MIPAASPEAAGVDSEGTVPLVVGTPGTLHGPGNKAAGGAAHGDRPPAAADREESGPGETREAVRPTLDGAGSASTGGGVSFHHPTPRLPRGYSERFCIPCNRRGAAHINGRCVMSHTHENESNQ